ncbi:MAG: helix-turn-helix domain-containing protein [Pseudonocardiaceae bacterium]
MAREPEELVEMRRVLGGQLAALRQAAGLTQGQLARATFRDRTSVAHIEKGRSRGDERFWKLADDACKAEGVLLAGFRDWEAARQNHEVRVREALLAEARAKAQAMRATTAPPPLRETDRADGPETITRGITAGEGTLAKGCAGAPGCPRLASNLAEEVAAEGDDEVVGRLVKLLCEWVGAMNRRKLFQLLRWATGAVATSSVVGALDTDERERLVRAIVSPSRVDQQVIDHLGAMHQYCKRQEDTRGARAVLNTVLAQRHLVGDLLVDCPATLRPQLLSVSSDMSNSIGFYFLERNDFDSAWRYYEKARKTAHDANNVELGVYALCQMSYSASWQGKAHIGIDLAAAAQSLVRKTDDALLRVNVADKAASAYATDGQYKACMAECERAQNTLASAGQVSAESPAYWLNEGFLASAKGYHLLRLGRPQEAVESASAGLELFDNSYVGGLAFCMIFLGKAYLQSGEIEEAARVLGSAANFVAQTRSERLLKELRATRARMQPWQNLQAVKVLDEQLAACGLVSSSATRTSRH